MENQNGRREKDETKFFLKEKEKLQIGIIRKKKKKRKL